MGHEAKAESRAKKQPRTIVKTEEVYESDEVVRELPDDEEDASGDEDRFALERQPNITWTDIANQNFLPRTMQRSRTCGLVLPWQLVLQGQEGTNLRALNAAVNAAALQAFAREAPDDMKAKLVAEGAGQYGRSLALVNALLKQADKVSADASHPAKPSSRPRSRGL